MNEITWDELLEKFDVSTHQRLEQVKNQPGVTHVVIFENMQLDSSQLGQRTAMIIGPECTYKTLEDVKGKWLNDLPSQRQYPNYYVILK